MAKIYSLRDIGFSLISIVLIIMTLGLLQIYSSTRLTGWAEAWWKQLIWGVIGLLAFVVLSLLDYRRLLEHAEILYFTGLVMLGAVLILGPEISGARRWLPLPFGFHLQVSEFFKVVLILLVARKLAGISTEHLTNSQLCKLIAWWLPPFLLVAAEPDLGTALSYMPILAVGIFLAGLSWRQYLALGLITITLLPTGWFLLKDYQRQRLVAFLDPNRDPRGAGYQAIQAKIAIGSGGLWGKGMAQGTQTQLRFLPVPHTDFIVASFAEEHGFVGVVLLLGLYFVLLVNIVQTAQAAPDTDGMYICMGVAGLLLFHVLVNVGMAVGFLPITGLPLPLMSYGGSNLLTTLAMLGIVNSVAMRRFVY